GLNLPPGYDLDPAFGVPESPYAIGGHHLTNGPTWIEQLAKPLGIGVSVLPAYRDANPHAMNYAMDGTRATLSPFHNRTLLSEHVGAFLADVGGAAPADALYVIEIGSNDVRDAIFALLFANDFALALQIIENAHVQIETQVEELYDAGARHFLYVSVPPVLVTPALNSIPLPPGVDFLINTFIVDNMNDRLDLIFGGLPGEADATQFDFFTLTQEVVAAPLDFGLTNVTDACITPLVAPYKCQNADEYLFWDVVHPTKAAHSIMADRAATALGLN
ncbi:MAG: SGNH/GDSL hydrolase family protein, partial [Nitrospinota bacterium]|nr:SGNH/GDSL hydrolase family protein [Nitrospinota bacterium]